MFSHIPSSDSQFYPRSSSSYGSGRFRDFAPAAYPYAYARVAEERAARQAAARRAAAEQEARARFNRYEDEDEDEYGGYGYGRGYIPTQRAYFEAQRKQQAAEGERARLIAEEQDRREAENRARREQEVEASLEQFYRNLGSRTPNVTPQTTEC